jgi:pimeloyl-ACP methyl ester carboxylesterase
MKTIYYVSGLGADERVFKYLRVNDVQQKYIKWEIPGKRERLEDYCKRLIAQIDPADEIILVGVSFGGIVAQEISKIMHVRKVIIISSIKSASEFDWQLKLVRKLSLHKLAPSRLLKWSNSVTGDYYFGTTTIAESKLLKQIIKDTDRSFMKWAIDALMKWNGGSSHHDLIHIHGDKDKIFPAKAISNFIRIADGGHFMIVNKAKEIAAIIEKEIKTK